MQSESVTKRSHGYDVWFAEERTWTARVTCPAPAELYPGEKGPFRIFDCLQKNLVFYRKMWYFSRKIRIYYHCGRGLSFFLLAFFRFAEGKEASPWRMMWSSRCP